MEPTVKRCRLVSRLEGSAVFDCFAKHFLCSFDDEGSPLFTKLALLTALSGRSLTALRHLDLFGEGSAVVSNGRCVREVYFGRESLLRKTRCKYHSRELILAVMMSLLKPQSSKVITDLGGEKGRSVAARIMLNPDFAHMRDMCVKTLSFVRLDILDFIKMVQQVPPDCDFVNGIHHLELNWGRLDELDKTKGDTFSIIKNMFPNLEGIRFMYKVDSTFLPTSNSVCSELDMLLGKLVTLRHDVPSRVVNELGLKFSLLAANITNQDKEKDIEYTNISDDLTATFRKHSYFDLKDLDIVIMPKRYSHVDGFLRLKPDDTLLNLKLKLDAKSIVIDASINIKHHNICHD